MIIKKVYTAVDISQFDKPEWGRFTQKGNKLYAHVMEEQIGAVCLPNIAGKVEKIRLLRDKSEILETCFWNLQEYSENSFFFLHNLPDEIDTVVEITLKEE